MFLGKEIKWKAEGYVGFVGGMEMSSSVSPLGNSAAKKCAAGFHEQPVLIAAEPVGNQERRKKRSSHFKTEPAGNRDSSSTGVGVRTP